MRLHHSPFALLPNNSSFQALYSVPYFLSQALAPLVIALQQQYYLTRRHQVWSHQALLSLPRHHVGLSRDHEKKRRLVNGNVGWE